MVDIELLKRLAEACDIERCADEEERDRNLNEFYSVLEPEDVAALIAENERLRQIISDSATACGAAMSAECTVEFMGHLPAEIAGVLGQLRAELDAANRHWANESNNVQAAVAEIARLKAENERLQAEQQEKIAWEAAPGLGICRYVTEARYRKFAPNIQRHYRPYTGDAAERDQLKAELERLQEQQKPAGGAGAAENCRCNEKLQVVQELQAEREALASLLRRFVENEHNPDEDQNDRHWYFIEAETLLAKIGGKYPDYALVPEEALYTQQAELERVRADAELLRKHLAECSDSLESEILDRYGSSKDHPAMRRKFERDMQDVIEARAAMGKGGKADG